MKVQCINHADKRCSPCSHEKQHNVLARWASLDLCIEPGFICEVTGKPVVCSEVKDDATAEN